MLKPEQVPEAAFKAAHHKWLDTNSTWDEVVAAALNAWPGAFPYSMGQPQIVLPLPPPPKGAEE